MKALSACIAIGVTILGCGSSSSGSGSGGSCGKVAACGGDIVGTWNITDSCASITSAPTIMGCPNATAQNAMVTASGTSTFNSDGTYTSDLTESASETVVIPMSCLMAGGMTVTCDQLSAALNVAVMGDAGTTASCTTSGSSCNCAIGGSGRSTHRMGTYSVSGNTITTMSGGTTSSADFCVQGSELHVLSSATSNMEGVTEDVVATKQ